MNTNYEEIKLKLKEQFYGIDEQIDQVINAFETWQTVKDYQSRPMTVCLWGLTGTGKTDLINKAIELIGLNKKKFYVKFGSKTSDLGDYFKSNNTEDTVFILDEFQYFRTKRECSEEIDRNENNSTNIIWELLDGGIINLYGSGRDYYYERLLMKTSIHYLNKLEEYKSTINNGIISHNKLNHILKEIGIPPQSKYSLDNYKRKEDTNDYDSSYNKTACDQDYSQDYATQELTKIEKEECYSRTEATIEHITGYDFERMLGYINSSDVDYNFHNTYEIKTFLSNFKTMRDLINFFQEVVDSKEKPNNRDYTKSIIFVIGNLDECFGMSNDINSDLDADYFYNQTKKINILNIRKALLKRFRVEQIARLGSTHIIYPSLNKTAFKNIISKELKKCSNMIYSNFKEIVSDITYTKSMEELIYKEGVMPVIGARQVFSTVNEIISDKLPYIIKELLEFKEHNNIVISYDYNTKTKSIIITIGENGNILVTKVFKYVIKIDKLRQEPSKGRQAHRAVHETGHAVCSIILEHEFPDEVHSVILGDKFGGFTLTSADTYYLRRNTYIDRIATLLAGYAAECIIFGEENLSDGSASDIRKATSELSVLFKECGFLNGKMANYVTRGFTSTMFENVNYSLFDNDDYITKIIEGEIKRAFDLATKTLNEQNVLFIKLSEYLSKKQKITKKDIQKFTKQYAVNVKYEDLLKNNDDMYVDKLNDVLKGMK